MSKALQVNISLFKIMLSERGFQPTSDFKFWTHPDKSTAKLFTVRNENVYMIQFRTNDGTECETIRTTSCNVDCAKDFIQQKWPI